MCQLFLRNFPIRSEHVHIFVKTQNVPLDTSNAVLITMPNNFRSRIEIFLLKIRKVFEFINVYKHKFKNFSDF